MRYFYLIFSSLLLIIIQAMYSFAQVSADTVYFNTDYSKTVLELSFEQPLSRDTVYSTGLPFQFSILAPYDSIAIDSVIINDEYDAIDIHFETRPNTYYSLLTMDIRSQDDTWHSYGTNFYTGKDEILDEIYIENLIQEIIVKSTVLESNFDRFDIAYNTVITNFLIDSKAFETIQNLHQSEDQFNFSLNEVKQSIISSKSFLFEKFNSTALLNYFSYFDETTIAHSILSHIAQKDSVILLSTISGRSIDNLVINSPLNQITYSRKGGKSYLSLNSNSKHDLAKPFSEWDSTLVEYEILRFVSNEKELVNQNPTVFSISSAYPNPFNPATTISFSLNQTVSIQMNVYSITGERVQSWNTTKQFASGEHSIVLNLSGIASGLYLVEFVGTNTVNGLPFRETTKVILAK